MLKEISSASLNVLQNVAHPSPKETGSLIA